MSPANPALRLLLLLFPLGKYRGDGGVVVVVRQVSELRQVGGVWGAEDT